VNILLDYGFMHATNGTPGKGIYVIEKISTVGAMGEVSNVSKDNYYDVESKKIIGRIYEIY